MPGGKRARVLVADDDHICRSLTEHTLSTLGVDIDVVKDGEEAVRAFAAGFYDLVLLDCHMPNLDGFGAVLLMREIEAGARRVPIVALTGSAVEAELVRCREVGMDGHLDKLSGPHELRQQLSAWLTRIAAEPGRLNAADADLPMSAPSLRAAAPKQDSLDVTALEQLKAFSDEEDDLVKELRDSFESSVAQQLPLLEKAARTSDAATVRFIGHKLRSTCGNLGARRMQFLCERLEDLGRDGVTVGAIELVDDLWLEFARVRTALDEWIRAQDNTPDTSTS
jgi:CheY-like chemotaxis protein/HPt (histidine-containing phosphotransfer) domain-containing protein